MTKRKGIKAGKHERIRKMLNNLRATQPAPMVREQPWLAEVLEHDRLSRRPAASNCNGGPVCDRIRKTVSDGVGPSRSVGLDLEPQQGIKPSTQPRHPGPAKNR